MGVSELLAWGRKVPQYFSRRDEPSEGLVDLIAGEDVIAYVESRSGKDVGGWLRDQPIEVALTSTRILFYAEGEPPYVEGYYANQILNLQYNHVTGELGVMPWGYGEPTRFAMEPEEARKFILNLRKEP